VTVWRNWSGEQACVPAVLPRPASTADVVREVERAAEAGRTVRVAGAGHSFTDAALTDGTLLSLDAMDRVLDADPATGRVRVQAGIRIHALSDALAQRGLALENLGDIDVQSIAGATATGTHGTGAKLRNISSQIEAVQLVTADGQVRELDGGDALRAARVSVGALGVVTELTLRTVPSYTLRGVDEPQPLADVLASLDERADASRHFELYVFPHSDVALTRTNEIVDEPPRPPKPARRWVEDVLFGNHGLRLHCELGRRFPERIPTLNRAVARAFTKRVRVDRADRIFASPRLVRFTEMEQAFPRASAREVIPEILATLERYPVVFPIEVRFVAGDDALLSPAGGRDTVYVAVHNFVGMPWEAPLRAVQAIGDRHGARPHWGKRHFHTTATLAPRYPEWEAFQRVRRQLDPHGRFANDYVRRTIIGPDPSSPEPR
jgi:L-gulono-1,4-lactone dehydrogenase